MMITAEQPQPERAMQHSERHVKYFSAAVYHGLLENSVRNEKAQPTILPVEADYSDLSGKKAPMKVRISAHRRASMMLRICSAEPCSRVDHAELRSTSGD
ncbi:hypothetical protein E4U52_000957 [Claviceps spartinae]|nr:hypothetical protein E4U52_000957 [Claviceps spartinae]